jgi:DNA-binding NtrC family response regulator
LQDHAHARILVVEDDDLERRGLTRLLRAEGHEVFAVQNADRAVGYVSEDVDLVISDLKLGDSSGLDLLQLWKAQRPDTQFVLLTGQASVNTAVEAMKRGAFDYVTKPVHEDELRLIVRRAVEGIRKDREIAQLRSRLDQQFALHRIIGQSRQMKEVFAKVSRAAAVDSTVLILGESGTGKELVAQALHQNSPRNKGPFVAVNCAAVPATLVESELFGHVRGAFTGATDRRIGRFEQADGGTLFIDEIGDFELGLQAKLLRVLETLTVTPVGGHEDRRVNVRVIAATSRDLRKMVLEGTFREDLFYRLCVIQITLPALRQRTEDIPLLVEHFLKELPGADNRVVAPELMRRFIAYPWPGNVRELRNTLESMLVLSDNGTLTEDDLPERFLERCTGTMGKLEAELDLTIEQLEKLAIRRALDRFKGNRTHAATTLGISVRTLQRKIRQYRVEPEASSRKAPTRP